MKNKMIVTLLICTAVYNSYSQSLKLKVRYVGMNIKDYHLTYTLLVDGQSKIVGKTIKLNDLEQEVLFENTGKITTARVSIDNEVLDKKTLTLNSFPMTNGYYSSTLTNVEMNLRPSLSHYNVLTGYNSNYYYYEIPLSNAFSITTHIEKIEVQSITNNNSFEHSFYEHPEIPIFYINDTLLITDVSKGKGKVETSYTMGEDKKIKFTTCTGEIGQKKETKYGYFKLSLDCNILFEAKESKTIKIFFPQVFQTKFKNNLLQDPLFNGFEKISDFKSTMVIFYVKDVNGVSSVLYATTK